MFCPSHRSSSGGHDGYDGHDGDGVIPWNTKVRVSVPTSIKIDHSYPSGDDKYDSIVLKRWHERVCETIFSTSYFHEIYPQALDPERVQTVLHNKQFHMWARDICSAWTMLYYAIRATIPDTTEYHDLREEMKEKAYLTPTCFNGLGPDLLY